MQRIITILLILFSYQCWGDENQCLKVIKRINDDSSHFLQQSFQNSTQSTSLSKTNFEWQDLTWLKQNLGNPSESSPDITQIMYWPYITIHFNNGKSTIIENESNKQIQTVGNTTEYFAKQLGTPIKTETEQRTKSTWLCGQSSLSVITDNQNKFISFSYVYCLGNICTSGGAS